MTRATVSQPSIQKVEPGASKRKNYQSLSRLNTNFVLEQSRNISNGFTNNSAQKQSSMTKKYLDIHGPAVSGLQRKPKSILRVGPDNKFQLISSGNKEQSYMNKELMQHDIIERKLSYQQI